MMNILLRFSAPLLVFSLLTAQAATLNIGGLSAAVNVTPSLILQQVKGAGYSASLDMEGDESVISVARGFDISDLRLVLRDCGSGSCKQGFIHADYDTEDLGVEVDALDLLDWDVEHVADASFDEEREGFVILSNEYSFSGTTKNQFLSWLEQFSSEADEFGGFLDNLVGAQLPGDRTREATSQIARCTLRADRHRPRR